MSKTYRRKDTAERYDSARALPQETLVLWMDRLQNLLPLDSITSILDLGAGTGRFTASLRDAFKCPVIAVDPSKAMLKQGRNRGLENIVWQHGSAENIPLDTSSVDLVWMSQVFHHLKNPPSAFQEIRRVLKPVGYLVIRNGTCENIAEIEWIHYFPGACQIEEAKSRSRLYIIDLVCGQGFDLIISQTVYQIFAQSPAEYYDKISQRGLSTMISISDEAFTSGLERLKQWAAQQPVDEPVKEPVDLLIFRVNN